MMMDIFQDGHVSNVYTDVAKQLRCHSAISSIDKFSPDSKPPCCLLSYQWNSSIKSTPVPKSECPKFLAATIETGARGALAPRVVAALSSAVSTLLRTWRLPSELLLLDKFRWFRFLWEQFGDSFGLFVPVRESWILSEDLVANRRN